MRPALSDYQHLASGKVRELYRVDDEHLFFFDYVEAPNPLAGPPDDERIPEEVLGRALVVEELEMLPVEAVARGYLSGSGLIDYQKTGKLCGIALPHGLSEASKFIQPLFTPATKAELGQHDENITF